MTSHSGAIVGAGRVLFGTDGDTEFSTLDSLPPTTTVSSDVGNDSTESIPELTTGASTVLTTAEFTVDDVNDSDVTVPFPQAARKVITPTNMATGENFTTSNYEL